MSRWFRLASPLLHTGSGAPKSTLHLARHTVARRPFCSVCSSYSSSQDASSSRARRGGRRHVRMLLNKAGRPGTGSIFVLDTKGMQCRHLHRHFAASSISDRHLMILSNERAWG
ncbi:hypothetical protein F5X68DRAFT_148477 [Plectosphaerella plurivora]|uniref:Uncharacterized protein n=1 Tax=Plectosphaerella plurivora TaxID=936078 RepID=A0A9P9AC12_9PEZI|nr:hypothetical protein F5X68DRAFT_148477 [Plectosphaerella plurivora]